MRTIEPFAPDEDAAEPAENGARPLRPALWSELALGFGYWLAFLLILQPGNIFQAAKAEIELSVGQELLRICGASLLGAAVTPLLLMLTRRFSIEGLRHWRHALIHVVSLVALALILLGVAQILAAWVLSGRDPRLRSPFDQQLVANGPLLFFCMAAFVAGAHAVAFLRRAEQGRDLLSHLRAQAQGRRAEPVTGHPAYPATVPVKTRGRTLLVPVAEIDWIETQGNYLALHVGPAVHLVRGTLARFEANLDPQRFVRIHRMTSVATDRVRQIVSLSNGDAELHLHDGAKLRLSRTHRAKVEAVLATSPTVPTE